MSLRVHIVGYHLDLGIDATSQEDAWLATIQIRSAKEVLGRAMAIAISPNGIQVGLPLLQSLQRIVHHLVRLAGLAIEIE